MTYEFEDESRTSDGTTVKETTHRFKEQVTLKTGGWVYHPALMQYSLLFEPEWSQGQEERSSEEDADINSFSPDYSVLATFLPQKPYTLNVFSSREEIPIWAPFLGNTESVIDTYGASVQFKNKVLPTTLGYSHIETDVSGFFTSQSIFDSFTLASRHQTARSNSTLHATYRDDERTNEGIERQIKSSYNSFLNTYRITGDSRVSLQSTLNYRIQESTDFDTENIRLKENLNWHHRKNLQTNYTFIHNRQETGDFNSDQTSVAARLTHLFYENLTTDFGGRTRLENFNDGRENSYDLFLDFDYIRPIPWGTLYLSSGWDYLYTDRSDFTDTVAQATNEPHILNTGEETFLDNPSVEVDSIVVTNASGTIIFLENIDYTIDEIDGFIRIRRLVFGAIPEGGVVRVSYRYMLDPEFDDTVFTENYAISFDLWDKWLLSYDYFRAKQDVLSGPLPQNRIDDTIHRARIRYDIGWLDSNLTYEDNNRQSDFSFTRWEIEETLRYRPLTRFYFTLRGYFGEIDYKNRDEVREFYGGVTTLDWLPTRWCKLRVEGFYDDISGDSEETLNTGIKADLELRYRIWTMHLTYELTDQDNKLNDFRRTEQLVRFEIIRILW
ncbi:MAG: hypothetical protein WBB19_11865 [Desulforhopalus sp.]